VVLASELAAVCRVRAGQAAPRLARTLNESRLARDQSSRPWRLNFSSSRWCSRCQTPARCQSRNRRQQVTGLPQPSSRVGSSRQGTPVRSWVDDADQGRAVLDTRAAAVTGWWGGQQRLDGLPQLLGDEIVSGDHGGGSCGRAGRAARTGRSSETLFKAPANARTASCAMLNCAMPARTSSCVVYRPNEMRTVLWGTILQAHRDEDVARLDVVGRAGRSHRHRDAAGGSAHQR
jgi:hypothetical protein